VGARFSTRSAADRSCQTFVPIRAPAGPRCNPVRDDGLNYSVEKNVILKYLLVLKAVDVNGCVLL